MVVGRVRAPRHADGSASKTSGFSAPFASITAMQPSRATATADSDDAEVTGNASTRGGASFWQSAGGDNDVIYVGGQPSYTMTECSISFFEPGGTNDDRRAPAAGGAR